ncbi:MAG TPA: GtrA family protein [Caulobacteraceae bacterium]|nr:GtrA family protein [Caulobacteraceae bacterium]
MKLIAREIPLFVLVGVAATLVNYLAALAAQRCLGAGVLWAGFVGYLSAVGISYAGNSRFTFRRPLLHGPQFARFAAVSLAGLAVNLGLIDVCAHRFGWPLWLALVPVVLIVPAATFLIAKFWAFRAPLDQPALQGAAISPD